MNTLLIQLAWAQGRDGAWYKLEEMDLSDVVTTGVYIIWHEGNPGRVVKLARATLRSGLGSTDPTPRSIVTAGSGLCESRGLPYRPARLTLWSGISQIV